MFTGLVILKRYLEKGFWASQIFSRALGFRRAKNKYSIKLSGRAENAKAQTLDEICSHLFLFLCLYLFFPLFSFQLALGCPCPFTPPWLYAFPRKECRVCASVYLCERVHPCVRAHRSVQAPSCRFEVLNVMSQGNPTAECLVSTLFWFGNQCLRPPSVTCSRVLGETARRVKDLQFTGRYWVHGVCCLRNKAMGTGAMDEGTRNL